jgi:hypothetical protein
MKSHTILAALAALILAPLAALSRSLAPAGADAINTAGDHDGGLSRIAEAAVNTPHLLLAFGTNPATQVIICTATTEPIGLAYDTQIINGRVGIERLGDGATKVGIASKAIAAGARIFTTAGGKITDTAVNNSWLVGRALSAAAADGDEFEFEPCFPVKQTVG